MDLVLACDDARPRTYLVEVPIPPCQRLQEYPIFTVVRESTVCLLYVCPLSTQWSVETNIIITAHTKINKTRV